MNELGDKLAQIQRDIDGPTVQHEGKSAEETYAERLQQLQLEDGVIQEGGTVVNLLLARCQLWLEIVQEKYVKSGALGTIPNMRYRQGKIDERFIDPYDKLRNIRDKLEQMNLTQAWSLRETDLYSFQRQLDRIDEGRVDGNFLDVGGRPADLHAQRVSALVFFLVDRADRNRLCSTYSARVTPSSIST